MENSCLPVARIGQKVTDMHFAVYNPKEGAFEDHSFGEFLKKGRWIILYFYPADFTFVCPTELADLADQHATLCELGAEVISVSTDTKFAHLAWRNSERLLSNVRYLMAADPTGALSRCFGVYDEADGTAFRGTFVINPEGVLVAAEVNYYNVGRNAAELVRKMQANKYLVDHPAEACPAKWEQGQKTLTPSEKIVGNVYDALGGGK